ncbi:MAG TPA: SDR family oxidoreductase [Acidimicrobiales bacterium]|nr:SDR family oxidoreductase [Acidimicrobiales bacterium]
MTGAGSGMGCATAAHLAERGWGVVAVDLRQESLGWTEGADTVAPLAADIATEEGNAAMVALAEETFGGLDGAVLNAAVIAAGPIDQLPIEDLDRMYAVNLRGAALGIRAVLPALRRRGGGAISVTSSMGGTEGETFNWAYGATKAGVINLVQSVAMEVGRDGIRVNALCPGPIRNTGMSSAAEQTPAVYDGVKGLTALKRWGEPGEIASVHEFLLSPASSYVTGATILVDGGVTAGHTWTS